MKKASYKKKENRKDHLNLMWTLAKTDFKLRYHGSILGYFWAILKPLLIFLILNFVFSQMIGRGAGISNYPLQLITGIIIWMFFAEGTTSGLIALLNKGHIISKIYFPRWIVIVASTLNTLFVFCLNLIVLAGFYVYYQTFPPILNILTAFLFIILVYLFILSLSFIVSTLYLRFRDLLQIWEVGLQALFYASPIIYPLSLMPEKYHKIILLNPIGMLIHYIKIILIENRFPDVKNILLIIFLIGFLFFISYYYFKSVSKRIAEFI